MSTMCRIDDHKSARSFFFIFQMETYPKAQCALPKGSRAAFVADEKVVTAARAAGGMNFDPPRDCKTES